MADINQWRTGDVISASRLNEMVGAINNLLRQQSPEIDASNLVTTEQLTSILRSYSDVGHTHHIREIVDLVLPTVPTKLSQLENDSDYATITQVNQAIDNAQLGGSQVDLTSYAKKTDLPTRTSQLTNDSGYITEQELNAKGYLTEHQDISNKADKSEIPTRTSQLTNDSNFATESYVTDAINNASLGGGEGSSVDLSLYQTKSDNTLTTTNKTIVGAINELDIEGIKAGDFEDSSVIINDNLTSRVSALETNKADRSEIPTRTSQLTNDSNFLTQHQDISGKANKSDIPTKTSQLQNDSDFATNSSVDEKIAGIGNSLADEDITNVSRNFTVNVTSSVLINPEDGYMQGKKIEGGSIVDNADYNITSFIPVSPGDAIVISHLNRMFWCNADKVKFDQQQQGDTTNYRCSNSNSNLAYIRFSYRAEFEEQLSVSINGTPLPSESFTHELTPNAYELPNMVSTKFYKDARENDEAFEGVDIFSIEGGTVKKPNSEDNATYYRIPALTVSTHGTLIAFTDVRFDSAADQGGRISIWCRRSEDKGRTWGNAIEVCKYPVGDNGDAASTRARAMDSTVISASNGKIFCLNGAWKSNGGNWSTIQLTPDTDWILKLSISKDDGLSWETKNLFVGNGAVATNLTGMPSTCVSCLGGVGQGIEMYRGTLVFPLQLTLRENGSNRVCATIMYSGDGGKNWRIASGFAPATSGEDNVVEIEPGVILMNARNANARQTFITYDMGETWEVYTPMNGKIGNGGVGCQGSSSKFKFDNGHEVFLHSSPINRNGNYTRDSITLYASYDWENYDKIVTYYPQAGNGAGAGYSCLAPAIIDGKQCLFAVYERQGNIAFRNLSNYLEEIENRANKFFASADRTFDMNKVDLLKLLDIDLITLKAIIKEYKDGTLGVPKDPILSALNEAMTVSLVGLEGGHVIDEGNVEKSWIVNAASLTWDDSLKAFDFGKNKGNSIYTENYNPNINFTIDFDVYIDGAPGVNWSFLFAIANTTDQPGFGLGINSTNTWNPAVDGNGAPTYTESSFVGRWIHITATKSSTQGVVIYQDNSSVYTKAEGTGSVASYSRFTIGNNCALAKAFDGKIANFKVFNKVVSEEERTYLYNHRKQ